MWFSETQVGNYDVRFLPQELNVPYMAGLYIMPERDHIWWPRTGICLTVHRDACARTLRVQTPLDIDMWHAKYFHAEFFNVVRRVAILYCMTIRSH